MTRDKVYAHRMKRAGSLIALGLIAGVVVAAMPPAAAAEQRPQHRERRGSDRSRHDDRRGLRHRHGHHARPFVTFYSPPSVVYYTYYTPPPVYYVPPVVYQPAPVSYAAPAVPRVIEYPAGRYELRGDGVWTPYEWTWIPNPPAAPPPPVEPPPPPVAPPPAASPAAPSPARDVFRWTDPDGVTTWTDRLDSIPEQYRAEVQRFR